MAPWRRLTVAGGVAFVVTSVLFLLASLTNIISYPTSEILDLGTSLARPVPPPPLPQVKPPEAIERREETVKIVKPRPRMVFDNQPDIFLYPGTGGTYLSEDFSFNFSSAEREVVFELGELDRDPRVVSQMRPIYPFSLAKHGIEGEVSLEFIVGPDGRVKSIIVIGGDEVEFIKEAISAVERWKFRPGKKDGKDVNTRMRITIPFILRENRRR